MGDKPNNPGAVEDREQLQLGLVMNKEGTFFLALIIGREPGAMFVFRKPGMVEDFLRAMNQAKNMVKLSPKVLASVLKASGAMGHGAKCFAFDDEGNLTEANLDSLLEQTDGDDWEGGGGGTVPPDTTIH